MKLCQLRNTRLGNLFGGLLGDNGPARPARIWGGVEYLLWWNKNRTVPVLATTSTDGTPFGQAGVIGQPGTSVLFGGGKYDDDVASGIRGSLGLWLDQRQTVGVWGRAYQLGTEDINFAAESSGSPILARPFDNVDTNLRDSLVVAYPGISRGRIDVATENTIRGYDVLLRKMLYYGNCNRVDFVGVPHHCAHYLRVAQSRMRDEHAQQVEVPVVRMRVHVPVFAWPDGRRV